MKMFGFSRVLVLGCAAAFVVGCTRAADESTKVSLILPTPKSSSKLAKSGKLSQQKVTTQSAPDIHVAINVTGEGANIYCFFDSRMGTQSGPCTFSMPSVSLDIPSGKGRLVQVLMVEDSETSSDFLYGENKQDLSGSSATVAISLGSVMSGSASMAHVDGVYIGNGTTLPARPTGLLRLRYAPANGSPPMTLIEREMFGGWFHGLAFQGVRMIYDLNGVNLFPAQPLGVDTADFLAMTMNATPNIADDVRYTAQNATFGYYGGWFGPGVTSATYNTTPTISSCSVNHYTSCLEVTANGVSPFVGPFKPMGGHYLTYSSGKMTFNYLPGIDASAVDGVRLIKIPNVTDPSALKMYVLDENKWNCAKLAADFPANQSTTLFSASPNNEVTATTPGAQDVFILCPMKGNALLTSAVAYPDSYNNFDRGGYQGPYLYPNFSGVQSTNNTFPLLANNCYPVHVGSYEGHGTPYQFPNNMSVTFSDITTSGTPGQFFYNGDDTVALNNCKAGTGGSSLGSISVVMGDYDSSTQGPSGLYYKPANNGVAKVLVTASAPYLPNQFTIAGAPAKLKIQGLEAMANGECTLATVRLTSPQGEPVQNWSYDFDFRLQSSTGLQVFPVSDTTCAGTAIAPATYLTFNTGGGNNEYPIRVKKGASGTAPWSVSFYDPTPSFTTVFDVTNSQLTVNTRTGSNTIAKIDLSFPNDTILTPGVCHRAVVRLLNEANQPVVARSELDFSVGSDLGTFHDVMDTVCGMPGISQVMFAVGDYSQIIYFKPSVGMGTMTAANGFFSLLSRGLTTAGATLQTGLVTTVTNPPSFGSSTKNPLGLFIDKSVLPKWKNRVVGDHEFPNVVENGFSFREIPISTIGSGTLTCDDMMMAMPCNETNQNDGSSYFNPTTKKLYFSKDDAVAGNQFTFGYSNNNGGWIQATVDAISIWGPQFLLVPCTTVLPSSGTTVTSANLSSTLSGTNNIVCLKKGAQVTMTSNLTLTPGSGLVGWVEATDAERTKNYVGTTYPGYSIVLPSGSLTGGGGPNLIANLDWAAAGVPALNISGVTSNSAGPPMLVARNNTLTGMNVSASSGVVNILLSSCSMDCQVEFYDNTIRPFMVGAAPSYAGVRIENSSSGVLFNDTVFASPEVGTSTAPPVMIRNVNSCSGGGCMFEQPIFDGVVALGFGKLLSNEGGTGTSDPAEVSIMRALTGLNLPSGATGFVDLAGKNHLSLSRAVLRLTPASSTTAAFYLASPNDADGDLLIMDSAVQMKSAGSIFIVGNTGVPNLMVDQSHFLRTTAGVATVPFALATGIGGNLPVTFGFDPADVKVCTDNASRAFTHPSGANMNSNSFVWVNNGGTVTSTTGVSASGNQCL